MHVRDYNDVNFDAVNIICKIRDKSLCVSGLDLCDFFFTVYVPDLFCVSCIVHVCCIDLDFALVWSSCLFCNLACTPCLLG